MRCQVFPYTEDRSIYLDWKREDGKVMSINSTISDGTLYINDLKKEDSGDYTCIGSDVYGKQLFSTKTRLNVVGMYRGKKNKQTTKFTDTLNRKI